VYAVTEIYPSHVVLDGNHPLAGLALRNHVKVLGVREATEAEAEAGSVGNLDPAVLAARPVPLH
jgi:FKBP-type peptidyl-prolyl cis-trans isomerase SlyD